MSLAPLYVKAAVSAVGPRASELPGTVLERSVTPDVTHLAEYVRVCGLRLGDTLPVTYPHVLGFGLQVELMAGRSFPLALPGLVHVANVIEVRRPVGVGETLDVRVHAEELRPHAKGAQVDLVTEVTASGEDVWRGVSTYLARGVRVPGSQESHHAATRRQQGGFPAIPTTAVWRVRGDTGRRYAAVSGDVNPIHLHPLTARAFGFPRAIAHGMWTAARALAALEGRLPDGLTYAVAFGRPLLLPSTVELATRADGPGWALEVRSGKGSNLTGTIAPR
jgi:acyl dehydratase